MNKREITVIILAVLVMGIFSFSIIYLKEYGLTAWITSFAIFTQNDETGFNEGTYSNTLWNGSGVVLSSGTSGTYTSKIFDAGNDAVWNNLTYSSLMPDVEFLFGVDGSGAVYKSTDGITWTQQTSNYGRTTVTQDMFADNEYIYITTGSKKELYRSSEGQTWSIISQGFTNKDMLIGDSDSNQNLYIADAEGAVYKSTDGITWTQISDFNSGATNNPKGIAIDSLNSIYIVDGSGAVYKSTDGITWTQQTADYGGGAYTDGMEIDSNNNLYILLQKKIYKSIDSGQTWTIITNPFTGYSQNGLEFEIDARDNFFILDGIGRVWKSIDFGLTWNEIGDFNGGATNDARGIASILENTNLSFQVKNCSSADCSDGAWQDADLNNLNFQSRYFQYKVDFTTPDSSVTPSLSSIEINYDLVNTPPSLNLLLPADGDTYGSNELIPLNFSVSDADNNLDSCWYNFGDENTIIQNCQNTTFNVAGNGNYNITLYANDSQNETSIDSATFTISLGSPTITISSPINAYLNYTQDIEFIYTATDTDLSYCELWGDFDGEFKLNQTHVVSSGVLDSFKLNLIDNTYHWNIRCADAQANLAFNGNKTFYVDTISPSLSLTQPSGAKSSRTITALWTTQDDSPISCKYNVYRGENLERANTSVDCSVNTTSFSVSVDADFTFNFYVEDEAGNNNLAMTEFSVDTSSPVIIPSTSGGSSGSRTIIIENKTTSKGIELKDAGDIIIYTGEKRTLQLEIKNNNNFFLNDCKITDKDKNFIESDEIKNLGAGEIAEFSISIAPLSTQEEIPDIYLECTEKTEKLKLNILLLQSEVSIEILEMVLEAKNKLLIKYKISGNNLNEQELIFRVLDSDENQIVEQTEKVKIDGKEKQIILDISNAEKGMLKISIENQKNENIGTEEFFVYNKGAITGFTANVLNNNYTYIGLIILSFLTASFFIIRRIIRHKKKR